MTRSPRAAGPAALRPREPRPSRGLLSGGAPLAVVLSIVGLAVIAVGTLALGTGDLPFQLGTGPGPGASGGGGGGGPAKTATPSNVVVVPTAVPGIKIPGTLVYAKDGNVWIQSNGQALQLTSAGTDSMPSFSPDGATVYFVRTRPLRGVWDLCANFTLCPKGVHGTGNGFYMDVPSLMSVATTGGDPTTLLDGLVHPSGSRKIMGFIREPVLSPDGRTIAIASDLPDPTGASDVTIKLFDLRTKRLTDPRIAQILPLGHQDPAWRPDGRLLLYVLNNRNGAVGAPQIYAYNPANHSNRAVTAPGYLHPSWSPDGKYIAATKTSAFGTDVAILNATTGAEVLRLTSDGDSWAPAWSPAGDQVAFLHISGQVVDLRMVPLTGTGPNWTAGNPIDLTSSAGLDSVSRPDWFVPADQLPVPTTAPTDSPAASPSAS
jgi:Tol biopolymer transport system component